MLALGDAAADQHFDVIDPATWQIGLMDAEANATAALSARPAVSA
jgi:hypothetical protein